MRTRGNWGYFIFLELFKFIFAWIAFTLLECEICWILPGLNPSTIYTYVNWFSVLGDPAVANISDFCCWPGGSVQFECNPGYLMIAGEPVWHCSGDGTGGASHITSMPVCAEGMFAVFAWSRYLYIILLQTITATAGVSYVFHDHGTVNES